MRKALPFLVLIACTQPSGNTNVDGSTGDTNDMTSQTGSTGETSSTGATGATPQPPTGADVTVTGVEDTDLTLQTSQFSFSDADGHTFAGARVRSLPSKGTLYASAAAATVGQVISDVTTLRYAPPANESGAPFTSFTFTVIDSSGAEDPTPRTLTINLNALNDAPQGTSATFNLAEDAVQPLDGTSFGFSDPNDSPPHTLASVRITALTNATLARGVMPVNVGDTVSGADLSALVLSPLASFSGTATLSFVVRDSGGADATSESTLTFLVSAANDAPSLLTLTNADTDGVVSLTAASAATGTVIGELSAVDVDDASLTFSLVAGTGDTDNASVTLNGATVQTALTLDGAIQADYVFRVRAQDAAGAAVERPFKLQLNHTPSAITLSNASVAENQAPGGIGLLSAVDADANDVVFFSLSCTTPGADDATFFLDETTLLTSVTFDYETKASYEVCVRATDGAGAAFEQTLTITVTNVQEAPASIVSQVTGTEDALLTFAGADFQFSDVESDPLLAVIVDSLPALGALNKNGAPAVVTDVITVGVDTLTYVPPTDLAGSDVASFQFRVRVANGGDDTSPVSTDMNISLTGVNDDPIVLASGALTFTENTAGTLVAPTGEVYELDGENLNGLSLQIVGNPDGPAELLTVDLTGTSVTTSGASNGQLLLLGPTSAAEFQQVLRTVQYRNTSDTPNTTLRTIQITSTDAQGHASAPVSVTMNVVAVNDAPVVSGPASFSTNEDTLVALSGLTVVDPDAAPSDVLALAATVAHGTLNVTQVVPGTIGGTGTSTLTISATPQNLATILSTLSYSPSANFNSTRGTEQIEVMVGDGQSQGTLSIPITVVAQADAPTALTQNLQAQINMRMTVQVDLSAGVSDPDSQDGGPQTAPTLQAVDASTCGGAVASVSTSDGLIDFLPPANHTGTCTIGYTVSDGALTGSGVLNINVAGRFIVFVSQNSSGSGRWIGNESEALGSVASAMSLMSSHPNGIIFISSGSSLSENVLMTNDTTVIGGGVPGTDFATTVLGSPGLTLLSPPTIGGTRPQLSGLLSVADSSGVFGVDFAGGCNAFGRRDVQVGHVSFGGKITLDNVHGTFVFANADVNTMEEGVYEQLSGDATITFDDRSALTASNSATRGMQINNAGGSVSFAGPITLVTGTELSIYLNNNTGAITFKGGLSLTSSVGAFYANNGGTLTVCDDDPCVLDATRTRRNLVTSGGNTAVTIQAGTVISSDGVTFERIDSTNGSGALFMQDTNGPFWITGASGAAGSGGMVTNPSYRGLSFERVSNVVLSNVTVSSNQNVTGVYLYGATGFTGVQLLIDVTGPGFSAGDVYGLSLSNSDITSGVSTPIDLSPRGGPLSIATTTVHDSSVAGVALNTFGATSPVTLTVTDSQLVRSTDANLDVDNWSVITVNVARTELSGSINGNGVRVRERNNASGDYTLTDNAFINNTAGDVSLFGVGAGSTRFLIQDHASGVLPNGQIASVRMEQDDGASRTVDARISGNVFSAQTGTALSFLNHGSGTVRYAITNNDFTGTAAPISITDGKFAGSAHFTIANNDGTADPNNPIIAVKTALVASTVRSVCLAINDNTFTSGPTVAAGVFADADFDGMFALPGFAGASNGTGFDNYIDNVRNNDFGRPSSVDVNNSTAFAAFANILECQLPVP